jgi:hypothetical protein
MREQMAKKAEAKSDGDAAFVSKLPEGRDRFLAHVIEQGLEIGRRTPEDFIRHFPPAAIMRGLENHADLRAQILVLTTGVKQKIAVKKSARSAGEDLQIALDEGETDSDSIVALFDPDDRVRYLDDKKLWAYVIEGEFWSVSPTKREDFDRAKRHIAFMLDRAIQDKLVTHRDLIDGITVAELASRLPKDKLGTIIERALGNSHKNEPFTEVDLLTTMPPAAIVDYVPLGHIWDNVVTPKIAEAHGYVEDTGETVKEALDWLAGDKQKPKDEGGDESAADRASAADIAAAIKEAVDDKAGPEEAAADKDEVEVTADDIKIT